MSTLGVLLIVGFIVAFALAGHPFAVRMVSWIIGYATSTAVVYLATLH